VRNGISVVVIALALAAIVAGFVSGQTASHPPPIVTLQRVVVATAPMRRNGKADIEVTDLFSDDDVVVERPLVSAPNWLPEHLTVVVGLCGQSVAVESRFIQLGLPVAFDLDPAAIEAVKFAQLVRTAGDPLYVHVDSAPTHSQLEALRERVGPFDGIASRNSTGMAQALSGSHVVFFDERGDADSHAFASNGVRLVRRDVTVDNRGESSYVSYMLARAADRSARAGPLVVLMRPLPTSLAALAQFTRSRNIELATIR
jgi:polysaccharide deacetylase 2 family uncharacterized protein YibQ